MNRRSRHRAILEIVHAHPVHSQAELAAELGRRGLQATQATVSRDVRQLGLLKLPVPGGGARYVAPDDLPPPAERLADDRNDSLRDACRQFVTEIDSGAALVVLKTLTGRANAVAVAIDECRFPEIVGTLAGDDTILLIVRRPADRKGVMERFRHLADGRR